MAKIKTFNKIAKEGLEIFKSAGFSVGEGISDPDAIVLRSQKIHDEPLAESLLAIGRAGAGVNNIPVEKCTSKSIIVFNTPGANANAVKELVLAGLLLSSRDIVGGINFSRTLKGKGKDVNTLVEDNKALFKGIEIKGKTLGVVGLGAIGVLVANAASALGMNVLGHDPFISVDRAWGLSRNVKPSPQLSKLISESDFITLHMPLTDKTNAFINKSLLSKLKKGAVLLNFSRPEIVSESDIMESIHEGILGKYVTDFPSDEVLQSENVIAIPHLGASTEEAETNCSIMIANQIQDFLENGNILNSVNFPNCELERSGDYRVTIINDNVPNMVGQITQILAAENLNITEMLNKSRGDVAYTMVDISGTVNSDLKEKLEKISGVRRVRIIAYS